jgi:acid phosphatase
VNFSPRETKNQQNKNGAPTAMYYARVLYSGQPLETIYGTLDWIELTEFISILRVYVPTDIVSLCNS